MGYKEAVAEARSLVKRSEEDQWRLAQLTYEQVEDGESRRRWAQDIGVAPQHASSLYRVWAHFGVQALDTRPKFAEAYASVHTPGRYEESGATSGMASSAAARSIRNMPPEQKAEIVREALAEPEVAEQVVRDHDARRTVRQATDRYDSQLQERAKQDYELREPRSVQIGAHADMAYSLTKARTAMEDAREAADKLAAYGWPDESRANAEVGGQRIRAAVELFMATVHGEDLDEELKALVQGDGSDA